MEKCLFLFDVSNYIIFKRCSSIERCEIVSGVQPRLLGGSTILVFVGGSIRRGADCEMFFTVTDSDLNICFGG
jgi:hypothetical protein